VSILLLLSIAHYEYLGIFLISILGNLLPFLPIPYLIPVFLSSYFLDPLIISLCVGFGATLGKCFSYLIGRGGRILLNEKKRKDFEVFGKLLGKYGVIAVYIFAAFPLPDDIIVIPLGMCKYDFKKFFISLLLGKITLGAIVAFIGKYYFELLSIFIGRESTIPIILISIIFMIVIIWIIYKINWIEAVEYIEKYGIIAYIKYLLKINKKK